MTHDEQMEIYNKGFEAGKKHTEPSTRTLELISSLRQEFHHADDKIISDLAKELKGKADDNVISDLKKEIKGKVGNKFFGWVTSLLMGVVVGMFYLVYNQTLQTTTRLEEISFRTTQQLEEISIRTTHMNNTTITLEAQLRALELIK